MSSFSNGDSHQSKGVRGGAGGFETTSTTRRIQIRALVRALKFERNKPILKAFYSASPAGRKRLCKLLGVKQHRSSTGEKGEGDVSKDTAHIGSSASNKRSQDKRESTLEPAAAVKTKKSKVEKRIIDHDSNDSNDSGDDDDPTVDEDDVSEDQGLSDHLADLSNDSHSDEVSDEHDSNDSGNDDEPTMDEDDVSEDEGLSSNDDDDDDEEDAPKYDPLGRKRAKKPKRA